MGLTSHHTWKLPVLQGPDVHHALCPDPYRSGLAGSPEEIAAAAAADIAELIRYSTPGRIAGFIAEPIQGVGGVTSAAPNYFREAYRIVREHGGLCIADEVQTGFGRTGEHYWGFQNSAWSPTSSPWPRASATAPTRGGHHSPRDRGGARPNGIHFNTFGGNPVSTAAGLAVMEVIEEEGLQRNAKVIGRRLKDGLERLAAVHPIVGDVRGMGLMLGVELVTDRKARAPASAETIEVLEAAREMADSARQGGARRQRAPDQAPMCITADDVDFALDVLDRAFARVEA